MRFNTQCMRQLQDPRGAGPQPQQGWKGYASNHLGYTMGYNRPNTSELVCVSFTCREGVS